MTTTKSITSNTTKNITSVTNDDSNGRFSHMPFKSNIMEESVVDTFVYKLCRQNVYKGKEGRKDSNINWRYGAKKMKELPNAGGQSELSEILSCEIMERVLGVELNKTE
ncbi:9187_t:CDS:2, partial [Scutellospora calospora]